MQSARIIQAIVVVLAIGLVAFLFFNGKNNSTALVNSEVHANAEGEFALEGKQFDFQKLEDELLAGALAEQAAEIKQLKEGLKEPASEKGSLEKLAARYEELKQPAMAAYYYKQLAEKFPQQEMYWMKTGRNFFNAQQTVNDQLTFMLFLNESMAAYDKVLELNPGNLEAKADQAVNYIEGKQQVMKGVGLLKEIEQVQPDHRRMLYYLGALSMKSGQYEKAVGRFEKLISLGPEGDELYPFYYRMLGESYANLGNKEKALEAYRRYKAYVDNLSDSRLSKEADELIRSVQ